LRSLPATRPATKIGQVVWAWPEIEAALAAGIQLKEVWEAIVLDGIEMSYAQFRVYVSTIRRRKRSAPRIQQPQHIVIEQPVPPASPPHDPFRNIREQREKKKQTSFEYNPFSIRKDLIS
jgi:hypothetical protein